VYTVRGASWPWSIISNATNAVITLVTEAGMNRRSGSRA
jgi:hypothetical protein